MRKIVCIVFLSTLLACSGEETAKEGPGEAPVTPQPPQPDGTEIVVDAASAEGPDIKYKRGFAGPGVGGFFYSKKMCTFLETLASCDVTIYNGIRSLTKDYLDNGDYPCCEFYYDTEEACYKTSQSEKFSSIRQFADGLGLEMISQVGGTAEYAGFRVDENYFWHTPDFAPLPCEEDMAEFQRCFIEFAVEADRAVGEGFHSIWIGTQEVAHTLGYPDGIQTQAAKEEAIDRYVDYWKPISDALRAAGARTGGIQLNSDNAKSGLYEYAVNRMLEKELQLDFLTFQFYQWGDREVMTTAVEALERYNRVYPETKIIINRGGYEKLVEEGMTESEAVIRFFLEGEKACLDFADKIYAYTLDCSVNGFQNRLETVDWQTKVWMNRLNGRRCAMSQVPNGMDGFFVTNGQGIYGVLWNESEEPLDVKLRFDNGPIPASKATVYKGTGSLLSPLGYVSWNADKALLSGISLGSYEFLLLEIH